MLSKLQGIGVKQKPSIVVFSFVMGRSGSTKAGGGPIVTQPDWRVNTWAHLSHFV